MEIAATPPPALLRGAVARADDVPGTAADVGSHDDGGGGGHPSGWRRRLRPQRLWRSAEGDPVWYRPALLALLLTTAVAYIWGLGSSGWANSFYSAAVQAGSQSWKAFFFGSFDSSSAITVDKPPASLWVMALSVRAFGLSSWSILVPEALMGVGSVALVAATVKRWFKPGAALLAGAVLATTPVATLMFRFNNPDALLVLLLCGAAYAVTRAIEGPGSAAPPSGRRRVLRSTPTRWLAFAGSLIGLAFLAKMLQAVVVLPAFAFAYLLAAPTTFWCRIRDLAVMGAAALVSAGWWVAIVELWPASSRPYIGGSQDNSILELILGYNGLGRLTGNETGSVGGTGGASGGNWGPTGVFRMFNSSFGGQISWLLPAALLLLVVGAVWTIRRPRTDRTRAGLVIWGGWLVTTGVVFSLSQGIIHEYYTVALAPAIGAVIGIGASLLWEHRHIMVARSLMAATVASTAVWTTVLLDRTTGWNTWLRPTVIALSIGSVLCLLAGDKVRTGAVTAAAVGALLAVGAGLVAPLAASATTINTAHNGSIVTAGPSMGASGFGPGGGGVGGGQGGPGGGGRGGPPSAMTGTPGAPGATAATGTTGSITTTGRPPGGGGMGGLLGSSTPSSELVDTITANADDYDWIVATVGSNNAAGYQLATGDAVMAIGGFNGSDPAPTLAQFQTWVTEGRIHYFVASGLGGGSNTGGSSIGSEISTWVTANFTSTTVGGVALYDLTSPAST